MGAWVGYLVYAIRVGCEGEHLGLIDSVWVEEEGCVDGVVGLCVPCTERVFAV